MIDPFAMHGNQPVLDEIELGERADSELSLSGIAARRVHLARTISYLLAPATISVPMILLLAFYQARNIASALAYGIITLFFLSIGPFAYILLGVRLGKLSDVDVSRRSERAGPFLFGLCSVCLGWFALMLLHGPTLLITLLLLTVVSGMVMMIITLWWKISLHASSLAAAATMLTVLYGAIMLPAFVLLVLVSWSRIVLRRHTPAQVVAGSLLGIALSAIILHLRGW